jgi:hypothetical protein
MHAIAVRVTVTDPEGSEQRLRDEVYRRRLAPPASKLATGRVKATAGSRWPSSIRKRTPAQPPSGSRGWFPRV